MIGTKGTRMDGQALNLPRKEGTDGPHRTFPVLKAFHPFLKTTATKNDLQIVIVLFMHINENI